MQLILLWTQGSSKENLKTLQKNSTKHVTGGEDEDCLKAPVWLFEVRLFIRMWITNKI